MAGGIKVALITTAAGLTIAIPVNIAYNYFVTRIDRLILDMEEGAQEVLKLALITTAAGLTIAIPVNIAYNYFVTRVDRLIQDMEKGTEAVLELIWRLEDSGVYKAAS